METVLYETRPYILMFVGLLVITTVDSALGKVSAVILLVVSGLILRLRYECRSKKRK